MAIIAVHVEGPVRQFRRRCIQAITALLGGLRIPSIPPGLPVQFADLSATSPFPGYHRAARIRLVESARALGLDACQKGWRRQENESSHLIAAVPLKTLKRRVWCPPSCAHTLLFLISQAACGDGGWEGRLSSLPKNFCSISTETLCNRCSARSALSS
jgi:hypothetical protein